MIFGLENEDLNKFGDWGTFAEHGALQFRLGKKALERHAARLNDENSASFANAAKTAQGAMAAFANIASPADFYEAYGAYLQDSCQRGVLTLDALRKRGDIFLEHEADGNPPVLIYDYDVVLDGKDLPRPCNYMLLRIKPPKGVKVFDWKRPYVIVDPRAGHGPGIGGFKMDSQVGVALNDGHPVYFVAFKPKPEAGQVLADVTRAEATFLREISKRHSDAPKPIVVGNCQGGWAVAVLAATNPDITGPVVLNGAPMSYWSGLMGEKPMRYSGGLSGGVVPALMASDMNGGLFDGANLVFNFETLNPGRVWFRKYYDLFVNIDTAEDRFLDFERWWGGYSLMQGQEMEWIVDNLFVGNKLDKNQAQLETGRPIDLKNIRAPMIVFASHGDTITPPQQALNWIVDTYTNETEIEIRGQRILYMLHEEVGHLGIFVSSSVARREHKQMVSTLKTIEALPPGLYEMVIEDAKGEGAQRTFAVSFHRRTMDDILAIDDGREEEQAFAAVARLSDTLAEGYDTTIRSSVRAMNPPEQAKMMRPFHPMRMQHWMFASQNPLMGSVETTAKTVRTERKPVAESNPFRQIETLWAEAVETQWNLFRDMRAIATEMTFLALYANPVALAYGAPYALNRVNKRPEDLRALPNVCAALDSINDGGLAEAVVRMLILLSETREDVRRSRLERSARILTETKPFSEMDPADRTQLLHRQALICHFEPDDALSTLPELLPTKKSREQAMGVVRHVLGEPDEMAPDTAALLATMGGILEIPAAKLGKVAAK